MANKGTIDPIRNIDQLDKEIYRQELLVSKTAKELDEKLAYLRYNFITLAKNSIKKKRKKDERDHSFFDPIFKNEKVKEFVAGVTDRITDRAGAAIDILVDRMLKKYS